MVKRTIIFIFAIVAIVLLVLGFFGAFYYKNINKKYLGKITYGYEVWPGVLPYLIAYEKGFFAEQGLDVKLYKSQNYTQEIDDFLSGRVDFLGDYALIDVIKKVSTGEKVKVVLATDYSNGADGIVTDKSISNVSQLKNKKVAVEKNTLGEYLLYDALKKSNLSLSDLEEIDLSAQDSAKAFVDKKVDACVTYEPDLSKAIKEGNGNLIYNSSQSPGLIIDTLVFRPEFIEKNPSKVLAVVKAYFNAVNFIEKNNDEAYSIGAKYFDITKEDFKKQYEGIKQVSFIENMTLMSFGSGRDSLHGLVSSACDFLQTKDILHAKVDSLEIIDPQFVRALSK